MQTQTTRRRKLRLRLPLLRDRSTKSTAVRLRVSSREKAALVRRSRQLGCTVTELLLGIYLEHGDDVVVTDR